MTHLAAFLNLACAILLSTETYTRVELSLRFVAPNRDGGHGCPYPISGNTAHVSTFPGGLRMLTDDRVQKLPSQTGR